MSRMTDKDVRRLNEVGTGAYAAKLGDILYDIDREVYDKAEKKMFEYTANAYDDLIKSMVKVAGRSDETVNITFDTSKITGISGVPATSTVAHKVGDPIKFPTFPVVPGKRLVGIPKKKISNLEYCYALEDDTISFSYKNIGEGIGGILSVKYNFYNNNRLIYSEVVSNGDRIPIPPAPEPRSDREVFTDWFYSSLSYGRNDVWYRNVYIVPGEYPTFHPCEYVINVHAQWFEPVSPYSDEDVATLSLEDEEQPEIPTEEVSEETDV